MRLTFPASAGLADLRHYDRSRLRGDLLGGLTVTAYAVPQVMARVNAISFFMEISSGG